MDERKPTKKHTRMHSNVDSRETAAAFNLQKQLLTDIQREREEEKPEQCGIDSGRGVGDQSARCTNSLHPSVSFERE